MQILAKSQHWDNIWKCCDIACLTRSCACVAKRMIPCLQKISISTISTSWIHNIFGHNFPSIHQNSSNPLSPPFNLPANTTISNNCWEYALFLWQTISFTQTHQLGNGSPSIWLPYSYSLLNTSQSPHFLVNCIWQENISSSSHSVPCTPKCTPVILPLPLKNILTIIELNFY